MTEYQRIPTIFPGVEVDTDGKAFKDGVEIGQKYEVARSGGFPGGRPLRIKYRVKVKVMKGLPMIGRATLGCMTFHGTCPKDKELVAHWNDIGDDDRPENLRWATREENQADARRNYANGWQAGNINEVAS